jgi:hypothetical protein
MKGKTSGSAQLPFNTRHMENSGKYHGTGIRGKTGIKMGTFTEMIPTTSQQKGVPPIKLN